LPPWIACNNLPRDARDTLFLLAGDRLGAAAAGGQPAAVVQPAGGRRAGLARLAGLDGPPAALALVAAGLLVLTIGATLWTHRTLLGRDAGVTLIAVLLALKTLELRARRDAFVVFFLGFFTMLTNFFFSQSLLTAAAMLVACWAC
jgi:hypothetical protein